MVCCLTLGLALLGAPNWVVDVSGGVAAFLILRYAVLYGLHLRRLWEEIDR